MSVARVSHYFPARFIAAPTKYAEEFAVAPLIVLESREFFCESLNRKKSYVPKYLFRGLQTFFKREILHPPSLFVRRFVKSRRHTFDALRLQENLSRRFVVIALLRYEESFEFQVALPNCTLLLQKRNFTTVIAIPSFVFSFNYIRIVVHRQIEANLLVCHTNQYDPRWSRLTNRV